MNNKKLDELRESLENCAYQAFTIILDKETTSSETKLLLDVRKDISNIIGKLIK